PARSSHCARYRRREWRASRSPRRHEAWSLPSPWVSDHPCLRRNARAPRALGTRSPTIDRMSTCAVPGTGTHAALDPPTMSQSTKRSKSRRVTIDRSATTDVVTQLVCAARNPHAAAIGAVIGGLVPWFGRTLAHEEIPATWSAGHHDFAAAMIAVVIG